MKGIFWLCSIGISLVFFSSCSRQISSLNTTSKLQTASIPVQKIIAEKGGKEDIIRKVDISGANDLCLETKPAAESNPVDSFISTLKRKVIISKTTEIFQKVLNPSSPLIISQKHTADTHPPHINKVGLILIGAGIVAFFLKLIPAAVIALLVIGVIILVAPLFRKRVY